MTTTMMMMMMIVIMIIIIITILIIIMIIIIITTIIIMTVIMMMMMIQTLFWKVFLKGKQCIFIRMWWTTLHQIFYRFMICLNDFSLNCTIYQRILPGCVFHVSLRATQATLIPSPCATVKPQLPQVCHVTPNTPLISTASDKTSTPSDI